MEHLCWIITDVPPQPNSPPVSVLYNCYLYSFARELRIERDMRAYDINTNAAGWMGPRQRVHTRARMNAYAQLLICDMRGILARRDEIRASAHTNGLTNYLVLNECLYNKSAKSSSSGVSWSRYECYVCCLLRSSPCRPDDNNRLESSSKGSSCPAVGMRMIRFDSGMTRLNAHALLRIRRMHNEDIRGTAHICAHTFAFTSAPARGTTNY